MKKYLFVIEADEYNRHFLHLDSDYAIIGNIELDHADVYGTFENYLETFLIFSRKVKKDIFILPDALGMQEYLTHVPDGISVPQQHFTFSHLL
jgi:UDP-N-acetylmuramate--alanine ligase